MPFPTALLGDPTAVGALARARSVSRWARVLFLPGFTDAGPITFPLIPRRRAGQTRRGCAGGSGPGLDITAKAAQAVPVMGGATMGPPSPAPPGPRLPNHLRGERANGFPVSPAARLAVHAQPLLMCSPLNTRGLARSSTGICRSINRRGCP
jgi:hypothetical protein